MNYKFIAKGKWRKEGFVSVISLAAIIGISFKTLSDSPFGSFMNNFLFILFAIMILAGLNKVIYYFRLHKKDYLIMEDSAVSIYRGNIIPRKTIPFNQVERVVYLNEMIVFKLDGGKEEQIYTDWLSGEDVNQLKNELRRNFGSKTLGF